MYNSLCNPKIRLKFWIRKYFRVNLPQIKKLTTFDDCTLSFTINGKPVSMNILAF